MSDDLNFNAEEFLRLPVTDRVRLCRRLAQRAQELAEKAEPSFRSAYADIALKWRELADEMENS
jgi:hypothetical protein